MSLDQKKLTCFYCDAVYVVSRTAQGDHFPVPRRHGGAEVVPCCRECHSLKDRMTIGDWNGSMIAKVISDFPKLSRETRIFLAKAMCALQDARKIEDCPPPGQGTRQGAWLMSSRLTRLEALATAVGALPSRVCAGCGGPKRRHGPVCSCCARRSPSGKRRERDRKRRAKATAARMAAPATDL